MGASIAIVLSHKDRNKNEHLCCSGKIAVRLQERLRRVLEYMNLIVPVFNYTCPKTKSWAGCMTKIHMVAANARTAVTFLYHRGMQAICWKEESC